MGRSTQTSFKSLILLLCCTFLLSLFVGCSSTKKTERYGVLYFWTDRNHKIDLNIYKEPANKQSEVVGQMKMNEQFRILGEKDFHYEIETKDKVKGWFPKSHTAECFYEEDFDTNKKEKKEARGLPDSVAVFGMDYGENTMAPVTWYEVSPKKDIELYEFPFKKSRISAHAKANQRYLITDVADTGYPKISERDYPGGLKASILLATDYNNSVYYSNNQVFDSYYDEQLRPYGGSEGLKKLDPDFLNNYKKYVTHWFRLKTEDGEGWVEVPGYSYVGNIKDKDNIWNLAIFCGARPSPRFVLHPKKNPIRFIGGAKYPQKIYIYAKNSENSDSIAEDIDFSPRVMLLEEKGGWCKVMSFKDGQVGWVQSEYCRTYKEAFKAGIEDIEKNKDKYFSYGWLDDWGKKEFP